MYYSEMCYLVLKCLEMFFRYLSFSAILINFNEVIKHALYHLILRNVLMPDKMADNMIYTVGLLPYLRVLHLLTEPTSDRKYSEKNFSRNFEFSSVCHTFTTMYMAFTLYLQLFIWHPYLQIIASVITN